MMRAFVASALLFFALPGAVFAATLSISPASGTYSVGERVIVNVVVSSDVSMNAAAGVLTFPTDALSVEYVNKGSVFNFWVAEPSYSNTTGKVTFEGVSLSGYQGSGGVILTVALRAKKTGTTRLSFSSGQILANDGQGTDITSGLQSATFTFSASTQPASKPPTPKPATPVPEPQPEPEPEPIVPIALEAPVIRFGLSNGQDAILGSSPYGRSDVVLTFVSVEGSKMFITGLSNMEGSFELPVPTILRDGPYAVTATMILENGSQTPASAPLTVQIGGMFGFLNWEAATYMLSFIIILLTIFLAYLLQGGHFGKSVRFSAIQKTQQETHRNAHTQQEKNMSQKIEPVQTPQEPMPVKHDPVRVVVEKITPKPPPVATPLQNQKELPSGHHEGTTSH